MSERDIAVEFHGAQQLRERIAMEIRPLVAARAADTDATTPQPTPEAP